MFPVQVQTVHYRVWCRLELQRWTLKLQEQEQCDQELGQEKEELKLDELDLEQDEEELEDEKELEETLESVLKSGGCWEILWRDGKVDCVQCTALHCTALKFSALH